MDKNPLVSALRTESTNCAYRIKETEESLAEKEEYSKKLDFLSKELATCNYLLNYLKGMKKDLEEYNAKKKELALSRIQANIMSAKSIVPDAGDIRLQISPKEAVLVDSTGCSIELIEGDAVQSVLSYFIRNVCLSNSQYMNDVIMDEVFASLSPETSVRLSTALSMFAKDRLVILIEQKDEVFANTEAKVYTFVKEGDISVVREGV